VKRKKKRKKRGKNGEIIMKSNLGGEARRRSQQKMKNGSLCRGGKNRFFCITINMKTIFLQYFPLK
jgi:hypothetical protein